MIFLYIISIILISLVTSLVVAYFISKEQYEIAESKTKRELRDMACFKKEENDRIIKQLTELHLRVRNLEKKEMSFLTSESIRVLDEIEYIKKHIILTDNSLDKN